MACLAKAGTKGLEFDYGLGRLAATLDSSSRYAMLASQKTSSPYLRVIPVCCGFSPRRVSMGDMG
ncbi:MAG: hypothetical protein NTU41_03850, partial [Chloroflexi bacterium]|nr:hypothetical protein [Chloroflexota bacterium]